jgi:UDP-N-acetylmuramate dehydrogenase
MTALDIQRDIPLAPLTTLELGGPARFFTRVTKEDALVQALRWAREEGVSVAVLGGGSNTIVPDAGYPGLVIHMGIDALELEGEGVVRVGAGVPWERVVDAAVVADWAGVECLTGIPGSTGATPIQNVGAYGQEVSEVIESVRVVDRKSLEALELTKDQCDFEYRDSLFKRTPKRYIVTQVRFALRPGGAATIRYAELMRHVDKGASLALVRGAVLELRRRKSMVIEPEDANRRSAGSFFLNPIVPAVEAERVAAQAVRDALVKRPEDVPRYPTDSGTVKLAAGWLIENSGVAKGTTRGPVGVSSRHALALVHHGGGTTSELLAFADEVRDRVRDRFGVELEREPRLLA